MRQIQQGVHMHFMHMARRLCPSCLCGKEMQHVFLGDADRLPCLFCMKELLFCLPEERLMAPRESAATPEMLPTNRC